jgi:hypothetical protein
MRSMRVLVGHEMRCYRQVIAAAIQELRPHVEVLPVDPEDLDRAILFFDPDMVVCSRLTPAVQAHVLAWVLLYPEGGPATIVSIAGQQTSVAEIEFDQLVSLTDQIEELVRRR